MAVAVSLHPGVLGHQDLDGQKAVSHAALRSAPQAHHTSWHSPRAALSAAPALDRC